MTGWLVVGALTVGLSALAWVTARVIDHAAGGEQLTDEQLHHTVLLFELHHMGQR